MLSLVVVPVALVTVVALLWMAVLGTARASPTQKRQDAEARERRQARAARGKTSDATANTAWTLGSRDDEAVR